MYRSSYCTLAMASAVALILVAALLVPSSASARPPSSPPKPVWPVPNPGFADASFAPSSNQRLVSGIYGPRLKWGGGRYDHHEGLDFYAFFDKKQWPRGDHPIVAVLDGVVSEVIDPANPERTETGRKVVITHAATWKQYKAPSAWGNVKTGYLHLSRIAVSAGQKVKKGEVIGYAGETGYTSTVHLHFNAYRPGPGRDVNVNPARLFSPKLFPGRVLPIHAKTVEVDWLARDKAAGTALVRVLLPYNAYTIDGFVLAVDSDKSRQVSFEHISAARRDERDRGDQDLFAGLRLFPMRYNGGGAVDRVNADSIPRDWPLARHRVESGKGVRLGFDILATDVPEKAKKFKLTVHGVTGDKVTVTAKGFREMVAQ